MEDNKLIAQALLEIAQRSETTFLEVGKEDKELIDAAKKIGIELPSPDLMVMKTVYAEIGKVNLNGVILPKKAVKEGLTTLIGKQCNWEHNGSGFVCGYTISAKINEDKVETINVLFKSLFPTQADELKEKVKSGAAAVSFEIWNKDPETGKSVIKELENGFREISPIIFHGTGVLLASEPACPKAKIFKLIAIKEIQEAGKIIDNIFSEDLVYAQMAIEEPKCTNCGRCNCGKEVKIVIKQIESKEWICPYCDKEIGEKELFFDEKTNKWYHRPCQEKGEIILPKETAKEKEVEIVEEPIKQEETSSLETKTEITSTETKTEEKSEVAETKVEEVKVDETKEVVAEVKLEEIKETVVEKTTEVKAQELEVIEPKVIVKVTSTYSEVSIDTYVDGTSSGTSETKYYSKRITEYKDGTKDEVETETKSERKYSFAELEEKVNSAKSEKDAEIATLKSEHEKVLVAKDEEIKNKNTELELKTQEIAKLTPKVEETKPTESEMTVGAVETKNRYNAIQAEINSKAFPKRK